MRLRAAAMAAVTLVAVHSSPLAAQRYALTGSDVAIYNLAGTIIATGAGGSDVVATVTPGGRDAAELRVETGRVGGRDALRVFADADRVVYPELGGRSRSTLRVARDGTFFDVGGLDLVRSRSVTIAGGGGGTEAFAHVAVEVPPGRTVRLYAGAGRVEVRNVDGTIHVRTSSARSELQDVRGAVDVQTASGGATIADIVGPVQASSSSGTVRVTNARGGDHEVRTSSGSIEATDLDGDAVRLTASSGSIRGGGIRGGEVEMGASSGSIRVDGLRAQRYRARTSSGRITLLDVDAAHVDVTASSGSVELSAGGALETLNANTSSGSVRAAIPTSFAGAVEIRTGSGSIDLDLPVTTQSLRRNELIGTLGDGPGSLRIRTSSGSVRISGSRARATGRRGAS